MNPRCWLFGHKPAGCADLLARHGHTSEQPGQCPDCLGAHVAGEHIGKKTATCRRCQQVTPRTGDHTRRPRSKGNTMTTTDRIVIRTKADLDNAPRRPGGLLLLGGAYLRGADLGDAYLRGADLGGADLRGADLRGADLRGAYLRGA